MLPSDCRTNRDEENQSPHPTLQSHKRQNHKLRIDQLPVYVKNHAQFFE